MTDLARRRFAVAVISGAGVIGPTGNVVADERLVEMRLIGKWQSDAERSMEFNVDVVKMTDKQRHFLQRFLGRMTLEFDETHRVMTMPAFKIVSLDGMTIEDKGWSSRDEYKVVAKTESEVAITSLFLGKEHIALIHFEDEQFWMYDETGHIREYFKRIA